MSIEITQADRDALAANLRRLRTEANLTQFELAKKAGLHHTQISRLENAKLWPRTFTAMLICRALDISIDDLLQGTFWTESERQGS